MKYYPMVWILWGSDTQRPWIEEVFAHKIMAEKALRHYEEADEGRGFIYWIQEKEVNCEQTY